MFLVILFELQIRVESFSLLKMFKGKEATETLEIDLGTLLQSSNSLLKGKDTCLPVESFGEKECDSSHLFWRQEAAFFFFFMYVYMYFLCVVKMVVISCKTNPST